MSNKITPECSCELNKVLTSGDKTLLSKCLTTAVIHDVDYLEVEVLTLPITDLSIRYMIRFSKPLPMELDTEIIRVSHDMTQIVNKSYEDRLKLVIRSKWKKFVLGCCENDLYGIENESVKEIMNKWYNLDEVRIVKLKLERDE